MQIELKIFSAVYKKNLKYIFAKNLEILLIQYYWNDSSFLSQSFPPAPKLFQIFYIFLRTF